MSNNFPFAREKPSMRKTEGVKLGGQTDRKDKGRIGEKGIGFD